VCVCVCLCMRMHERVRVLVPACACVLLHLGLQGVPMAGLGVVVLNNSFSCNGMSNRVVAT
jgi:hypothetical protein